MEEESFDLLSSLSPKVKNCQKHFRKGTTVLALRKSLRRSSIHDRSIHTQKNEELVITESSSFSTSTSNSRDSSASCNKLLHRPIIIHDSDSENEFEQLQNKHKSPEMRKLNGEIGSNKYRSFSQDKVDTIRQWIDNVNFQNEIKDSSIYSELSTVYGDQSSRNFVTERTGRAVNSTATSSTNVHFHELFKKKTDESKNNADGPDCIDESCIEERVTKNIEVNQEESDSLSMRISKFDDVNLISNPDKSARSSSSTGLRNSYRNEGTSEIDDKNVISDSDDSFSLNESLNTRLRGKKYSDSRENKRGLTRGNNDAKSNVKDDDNGVEDINENELVSMLDDLYGDKWREKEEHILPKSEPRKRHPPKSNDFQITNSERKPKSSILYKNPYVETERQKSHNLLKSLHLSRLKNNVESPIIKQLKTFCDSDTDSDKVQPKQKLSFDISDSEDEDVQPTSSKYFKKTKKSAENDSDKENLDAYPFLGESLEDTIRRKMNGLEDSKGGNKNKQKKGLGVKKTKDKDCGDFSKVTKSTKNISKKDEQQIDNRICNISDSSSDVEWELEISKIVRDSKPVSGKYSFLASLSANVPILQCDMTARIYRNNFKSCKDQLLAKLFKLFNEKVFDNAIPQDTLLEWNDRMRGTAGFCYCKRVTRKTGAVERSVRIVLSTKVIDAANRLRDTLIHEMCHAATWIVNCVSDGHGRYWKSWACKAMKTFPELPPIKRCHDYVIRTKYTYKCTGCGYSIGRHSKSLDVERKRCGYCLGKFEILLNKVSKKGETKSVPATPKKQASGFALFVKENYSVYKQTNRTHGEVMKLLGQKFQEMKLKTS